MQLMEDQAQVLDRYQSVGLDAVRSVDEHRCASLVTRVQCISPCLMASCMAIPYQRESQYLCKDEAVGYGLFLVEPRLSGGSWGRCASRMVPSLRFAAADTTAFAGNIPNLSSLHRLIAQATHHLQDDDASKDQ